MKPDYITDKAWDRAQELLKTGPKLWSASLCAGTYITPDGEDHAKHHRGSGLHGAICHGFMQEDALNENHHLFFNTIKLGPKARECDVALMAWLKDESPFRAFILNDTVESMTYGGIIIDMVKCQSAAALGICKIARLTNEDTYKPPVWHDLVKQGVHPMLAMLFAQSVGHSGKSYGGSTHNSCLPVPKNLQQLKDVLAIKDVPARKNVKERYPDWTVASLFGLTVSYGKEGLFPYAGGRTKTVRTPDGWGGYVEKQVPVEDKGIAEGLLELQKECL